MQEVLKDWSVFGKDAVASPKLLRKRPVAILLSFVAALLLFLFASKPGGELRSRITVPDFLTQIGALNDFARLEREDR